MKNKIIWITSSIILFVMAISYLAVINSVEEPFEEQGREESKAEEPKAEEPVAEESKFITNSEPTSSLEYEQLTQRIKEIKITESKSIYDLENEYDTSNRLIELGWNKPTEQSPEFTITDDLNIEALNSVKEGVIIGTEYLGNYGPLKVFIIGSDIDKAKIVAKEFCEWAYEDKSMIEHCINKDQGIGIVEMAIYKGNNGFAQHSREIENPNQSFVMGNPDKYAVKISIHEYVHIYQNAHKVDGWWNDKEDDTGLPRWLEEGSAELLAMHLVGDHSDYLSESLKIAKSFKSDNPNISIRNLENEEDLRILEKIDCLGGSCVGTLQYETGAVATALLVNQTSMDYFYKEYIPKIAYLGGEKAFETSFNITINEFHEIFDSFLDLSVEEMMSFLNKY
ncbi:MAG: hypothetical protein P8K05_03265 [Dehalococcoidia bacterium]|nr:hypothetical protein [Dehalococcoidia bacterium]